MFGDDAFKFLLSAGFEQGITITIKLIAKLNTALASLPTKSSSWLDAPRERLLAEVLPIEVEQIKCIQNDAMGLPPHRSA